MIVYFDGPLRNVSDYYVTQSNAEELKRLIDRVGVLCLVRIGL